MKILLIAVNIFSISSCISSKYLREYQIIVEENGSYIYQHKRFVGFIPYDSTSHFDLLMLKDNL